MFHYFSCLIFGVSFVKTVVEKYFGYFLIMVNFALNFEHGK